MTTPVEINHVALTVAPDLLEGAGREAFKEFVGEVFQWQELPEMTVDAKRLVFRMSRPHQYLFLVAGAKPSVMGEPDHFGVVVEDKETLHRIFASAKRFKDERDAAVEIRDVKCDIERDDLSLWAGFIRYRLPLMIEVQYYDVKADV